MVNINGSDNKSIVLMFLGLRFVIISNGLMFILIILKSSHFCI